MPRDATDDNADGFRSCVIWTVLALTLLGVALAVFVILISTRKW
ncbi:hypothetical protein PLCT2_01492 [Planctomycetaceae bacterium]|nr:hypothetical protein PLCT2_01492 [Planctomycetaceae bacterium]